MNIVRCLGGISLWIVISFTVVTCELFCVTISGGTPTRPYISKGWNVMVVTKYFFGPECTETAGLCRHCKYVTACFTVMRNTAAAADIAPAFEKRFLRERRYASDDTWPDCVEICDYSKCAIT